MNRFSYRSLFIYSDLIASGVAWSLFFVYRKLFIETVKFGVDIKFEPDTKYFLSLICIPVFWLLLYYSAGTYDNIKRKSHGQNLLQLFSITLLGAFIIFFLVLLDDTVISYKNYYTSFLILFLLQFLIVFVPRSIILYVKNSRFKNKRDCFRTLIIGDSESIRRLLNDNAGWVDKLHINISAYILLDKSTGKLFDTPSGDITNLDDFINEFKIEEVFIVSDTKDQDYLESILLQLFRKDVYIRITPELYTLVKMPIKFTDIFHSPFLMLSKNLMPAWQQSLKVLSDMVLSALAILILFPLAIVLAIIIKATSQGPVIYSHERIGKNGRPFNILKFRSMYVNSEPEGPQLATRSDRRITPVGRFMRKRRLDEIPNFLNVFKGDMSLVGPRPERCFFIKQIIDKAPQYSKLHLVKPGITSWGQVKYGYAENLDEMIKRMRYDLVYIENMSLYVDFQILIKTIGIVITGKGI